MNQKIGREDDPKIVLSSIAHSCMCKKLKGIKMAHIKFDYSKLTPFVADNELDEIQWQIDGADKLLREGKGAGSDFIGWLDLPEDYDKEEFARIQKAAEKIKSEIGRAHV